MTAPCRLLQVDDADHFDYQYETYSRQVRPVDPPLLVLLPPPPAYTARSNLPPTIFWRRRQYPGRTGSFMPFTLMVLKAELPAR